jgi:MFS family permease
VPTYLAAALLARTGDEGAKLAVMLLALAVATPSVGGYGVACLMAPHVFAAPLMGRWIDRSRVPHRILAIAAVAFAGLLAAACAGLGRLPDLAVMGLLLAAGLFGPAITGGLSSMVRLLTTEGQLPRAFGMDSLVFNVAGMIGPAVAAAVAVNLPREACYLVAGLVAVAAIPLWLLRPRGAVAGQREPATQPSLLGGLRSIVRNRPLALATAGTSLAQIGAGALAVAIPLRAHALGAPQWAGWWFAALAGGALLGSIAWTLRPARIENAFRVVMVALAFTGIALLGAALLADRWLILLAMAVAGFANGPQFGALQVVRDRGSSPRDRAGVFTLGAGIKVAAAALGTAVAGQLAGLSPQTLLLGAAVAPLIGGAAGLLLRTPSPPAAEPARSS